MSEFPKLAMKGREEFAMLKSSLLTRYVGLKSKGKNSSKDLVQSKIDYTSYEIGLINKAVNEYNKSKTKDVQKIVAKMAKSKIKNKEDVLAI